MQAVNYFARIEKLVGDEAAIEREKARLDIAIADMSSSIKAALSSNSVPGVIWHLAVKELERIRPLVGITVSNFAGHARFLRALAAATPFDSAEICDDPGTDGLLETCAHLWQALFFREMMNDLEHAEPSAIDAERGRVAALMSLLDALQQERVYIDQAEARIRSLYSPFSREIVEPDLGLSVEDLIAGFGYVRDEIARRINRAADLMRPLCREWQGFRQLPEKDAQRYWRQLQRDEHRRETTSKSFQDGIDLFNHLLIVTPTDLRVALSDKAGAFLDAFSFKPGEVNLGFETPFDPDAVRARPFARLRGSRFLLFDPIYASFAPLYRLEECFANDARRQRLYRQRDKALEDDAARILVPLVNPELRLRGYYVPVGKTRELAERDLLLFRNGILLLVESKAKPLRPISGHRGNVRKIESDVKAAIQAGYDQACAVWRHIESSDSDVVFFDSDKPQRKEIARLNPKDVRKVFIIVVADSSYGLVGTNLAPWLVVNTQVGFPWVINRDAIELIALKIDNFDKLTSFLEWRRDLHGSAVHDDDEAVIAGFFVRHGPAPLGKEGDLQLLAPEYTDVFEHEYLQRKGIPVGPPPVGSDIPVSVLIRRDENRIVQVSGGMTLNSLELYGKTDSTATVNDKPKRRPGRLTDPSTKPTKPDLVRRNEPCPCGSGIKFKRCCLRKAR